MVKQKKPKADKVFTIRFTKLQWEFISREALEKKMNVGAYIRQRIFGGEIE